MKNVSKRVNLTRKQKRELKTIRDTALGILVLFGMAIFIVILFILICILAVFIASIFTSWSF